MDKMINEYKEGDHIAAELLVTNAVKGVSNAGAPYLSLTLQDRTGTIDAKRWDSNDTEAAICQIGDVILVNADVIDYRGNLQLKVIGLASVDQRSVDYSKFCLPSPVSQQEMVRQLKSYLSSIKDEELNKLVNYVINEHYDAFISYPAAVRNHHEYASGLLYHTLSMTQVAEFFASFYDDVDRDLLIAGTLLHDVGKTIELSGPIATKYTLEGKLIGHIAIMVSEIREASHRLNLHSEKILLLEHMILSHHGEKEFGSPIPPLTKEAFLLHAIDDLDAKMNIISKALDGVKEGEFSSRVLAMDGRSFYQEKKNK